MDLLIILSIIFVVAFLITYFTYVTEKGISFSPLRWRQNFSEQRELKRSVHISQLEHELGYKPCSWDGCYTCKRLIPLSDGQYYQMSKDIDYYIKQGWEKQVMMKSRKTSSGGPR